MRLVYQHENRGLVYSVRNILAMNDIDCHVKNDHSNTMGAEFGIGNIQLELWVMNDSEYTRAREIIDAHLQEPENAEDWTCSNCGETNAAQFGLCWNCQSEVNE